MANKTQTFNLRLSAEDRKRLDLISEELSAPAATAIRILIKQEHNRILRDRKTQAIDFGRKRS